MSVVARPVTAAGRGAIGVTMSKPFAVVVTLAVVSAATAQTTHLVGPGGFAQIAEAVAAAASGDVILVQPGVYGSFFTTKGLTIRATVPGAASAVGTWGNIVYGAGRTTRIVGMRLQGFTVWGGTVELDDCIVEGLNGRVDAQSSVLVLQRCTLQPVLPSLMSTTALRASGSEVTAIDCDIRGHDGAGMATASYAVDLIESRFRGSGLTIASGAGNMPMPGIRADAASRVWISDSTVTGTGGACAIDAPNGRHDRCVLTPPCTNLRTGFVLGVHRPQPPQLGGTFTVEHRALPGMLVGVLADFRIERSTPPLLEQALLLPAATAFPADVLVADGTGLAVGAWGIPALPALVDTALWFQAFAGTSLPLQAGPPAGGLLR